MADEALARQTIDRLLTSSGWAVQNYRDIHLGAAYGVAVREFPLQTGIADYLLFANRTPLPFLYESTGTETVCTDGRDPDPRTCMRQMPPLS